MTIGGKPSSALVPSMGWAGNSDLFFWPRNQPDCNPEEPQTTYQGAVHFMLDFFATLSPLVGHTHNA